MGAIRGGRVGIMRWVSSVILGLLWVVAQWGPRLYVGSEDARDATMEILAVPDAFLRSAWSPTLAVMALGGLVGIWVAMPLARIWREKVFGASRREFIDQFNSTEQTISRRNFQWNIERAYRIYKPTASNGELADMLSNLNWPSNFPPNSDIIEYSKNLEWPDQNGKDLWGFVNNLFVDVLDLEKRHEKLPFPYYHDMIIGRFVAAKFWNVWSTKMIDGFLNPNTVAASLESNKPDIRALALCELALAKAIGWDHSRGKTGLFLLARDHTAIAGGPWFIRTRRLFGSLFVKLGERIRGKNGTR